MVVEGCRFIKDTAGAKNSYHILVLPVLIYHHDGPIAHQIKVFIRKIVLPDYNRLRVKKMNLNNFKHEHKEFITSLEEVVSFDNVLEL